MPKKKKRPPKKQQPQKKKSKESNNDIIYVKEYFSKAPGEISLIDISGNQIDISKEYARKLAEHTKLICADYKGLLSEIKRIDIGDKKQSQETSPKDKQATSNKPVDTKPKNTLKENWVFDAMGANNQFKSIANDVINKTPKKSTKKTSAVKNVKTQIGEKKTITDIKIVGPDKAEVFYDSAKSFKNPIRNIQNWLTNNAYDYEKWIAILNAKNKEYKSTHFIQNPPVTVKTTNTKQSDSKSKTPANNNSISVLANNKIIPKPNDKQQANTQSNELAKSMQEGIDAVRDSNYEKARKSFLSVYGLRKSRGDSNPSAKLLGFLFREASTALDNDIDKAYHLFDLYYEIQLLDKNKNNSIDDNLHIWNDIIVDWKNGMAVDSVNNNPDLVELPEGVIGISKDFEKTLASAKKIIIPSSFRFFIKDDRHFTTNSFREFLLKHCGSIPNISISGKNRFVEEKNCFLFDRSLSEPFMLADNSQHEITIPNDWDSVSSTLFVCPDRITSITIPKSLFKLIGKNNSPQSFFDDLPNLESFIVATGNPYFSASENVIRQGTQVIRITNKGTELVFPSGTKSCPVTLPSYWQGCDCIEFPGSFDINEFTVVTSKLHPKKLLISLELYRKLQESRKLPNQKNLSLSVFDGFGIIPPEQMSFYFRRRTKLSNGTIVPAVPLRINDIVSVLNTFQCVNKGHQMVEIAGLVGYGDGISLPREIAIRCFYCRNCRRYFMYSTDFDSSFIHRLLSSSRYCFFTKIDYNGKIYDSRLGLNTNGFAQESLLKKAGYQVNQTVNLSSEKRLSVLMFLYDRGVSPHFILSYLNQFINLNGNSYTKNMSVAVSRWKEDMQAFKFQVFGHN